MYEYKPQRTNNRARLLVLGLLALAGVSFVTSAAVPKFPFIFQSLGLLLLLPAIQLLTRFVVTQYLYRIVAFEGGEVDLEIYAYRGGDKMQLVCRVGAEEITALAPLGEGNRKPPHNLRRYNYCMDLAPASATVLSITNGDGDCEVLFSPDAKMLEILKSSSK